MSGNRGGTYAYSRPDQFGARKPLEVVWAPNMVMIETEITPALNPGFTREAALAAGREFASILHRLSEKVAQQQPDMPPNLDAPEDIRKQQLRAHDESLYLDAGDRLGTLLELREVGAGLRSELREDEFFIKQLHYNGFPEATAQEDPQNPFPTLLFRELGEAPILWEMLYEGGQGGDPEWERFWGLRLPITHWRTLPRNDDLRLQGGMFSAINEDLDFAGQEILEVGQLAGAGLHKFTLADMLRSRVREEIIQNKHLTADEADAWFKEDERGWLRRFLTDLTPDVKLCDSRSKIWKKDALIATFTRPPMRYDLIHFACHCQASEKTEFLSQLEMKVAGESIALDVSLMASDLRRKLATPEDPGPLVFLNACGTAKQSATYEPPGFPQKWIEGQLALAVIATLCPVPNYFAHAFARKFYEILFKGVVEVNKEDRAPEIARQRFIADALLATRQFFMKPPYNNPLGLAYVLYGFKGVQVRMDFAAGGSP